MSLDEELDEGIRATVLWLRRCGFETTDSGDGYSKPFEDRALDQPHVVMKVDPARMIAEAHRLRDLIAERGWQLSQMGVDGGAQIQATYDPVDGTATIVLLDLVVSDDVIDEPEEPKHDEDETCWCKPKVERVNPSTGLPYPNGGMLIIHRDAAERARDAS